jgi:hypothetical protein
MGTFAGNALIDDLSRRLRDTANLGYPRNTVLDILNRSQRSINAHLGLVTSSATLTTSNTSLYSIPAIASDIVRIIEVRDSNRLLHKVPWEHLVYQDAKWLRLFGEQAEVFTTIGRDLLTLTPIPVVATPLTIVYVSQTVNMTDGAAPLMAIPDEHKPILLDLSEAVLLFRGREFKMMQQALQRLVPALSIEDVIRHERQSD